MRGGPGVRGVHPENHQLQEFQVVHVTPRDHIPRIRDSSDVQIQEPDSSDMHVLGSTGGRWGWARESLLQEIFRNPQEDAQKMT